MRRSPLLKLTSGKEKVQATRRHGDVALLTGAERSSRATLDFLAAHSTALKLHERQILEEALLQSLPHCTVEERLSLARRVAGMRSPPQQLVIDLMTDPTSPEARVLIETCSTIREEELMKAIWKGGVALGKIIAARQGLAASVCRALVEAGDTAVLTILLSNPKAEICPSDLSHLVSRAKEHPQLLAPLAARSDLPVPIAFELFWPASGSLRRKVLERYLTETDQLRRILQLVAPRLAASRLVADIDTFVSALIHKSNQVVTIAVSLAGITRGLVERIVADKGGEALAIFLKALGYPRGNLRIALEKLFSAGGHEHTDSSRTEELLAISDRISISKARTIVTLWDWTAGAQKIG